jgi:hypothetical protein
VGKIRVHELLIHIHSSSFITCNFSLTLNDCKLTSLCAYFWRQRTQHTMHYVLWWVTGFAEVIHLPSMGMLRHYADCHIVKHSNVTNVCAQISHVPQVLVCSFSFSFFFFFFKWVRYSSKYGMLFVIIPYDSFRYYYIRSDKTCRYMKGVPEKLLLLNKHVGLMFMNS